MEAGLLRVPRPPTLILSILQPILVVGPCPQKAAARELRHNATEAMPNSLSSFS